MGRRSDTDIFTAFSLYIYIYIRIRIILFRHNNKFIHILTLLCKTIDINLDFENNHSTSHAIITLVERVSKALDTNKYVVGVFVYIKKTFDTVDHNILLAKLKQYGIRGNTHSWFVSYLSNRKKMLNTIILNPIQKI